MDERDQLSLASTDAAIIIRENMSIEGYMPHCEAELIEPDTSTFWAYAIMMMMGEGEEPAKMRETLKEWFEKYVNDND